MVGSDDDCTNTRDRDKDDNLKSTTTMTQINRIEFRNVLVESTTDRNLNVLTFAKQNYAIYFSLQSIAQCFNELIDVYGASEIFHNEFHAKWVDLNLKCMTEFQITLLVPINLIMEPSTELYNPMPAPLTAVRYLNEAYANTIGQYADHMSIVNDVFCIAERQNLTNDITANSTVYHHQFMNAIGFLSFIPVLRLKYLRIMYKTFFLADMMNSNDVEYIYDTLILNRKRLRADDIANVFQLVANEVHIQPIDMTDSDKELFVTRFNRACRVFKSFAFNIMDDQATYISRNLQLVTQFGLDKRAIEQAFNNIPKLAPTPGDEYTKEQLELLCREPSTEPLANMNAVEVEILHCLIRIHLMMQRMTNIHIQKEDLEFYRKLLSTRYSMDLCDLITEDGGGGDDLDTDCTRTYCASDGKRGLTRNYTIGEIVGEFLRLYLVAQRNINTIWLCQFIRLSCNPRYSNLINIMADFVPYFQRFFTNDFNVNSINNMILFLQGRCRPDETNFDSLKNLNTFKALNVQSNRTFSLTRFQAFNSNPLITFMDVLLTSRASGKQSYILNMAALSDIEKYNLVALIDPRERQFVNYIHELIESEAGTNSSSDLSGDRRFHLQEINFDNIVPIVSTNTFNENNTTTSSIKLFNSIINQTTFFHELSNRIMFKVPGVVCNVVLK